MRINFNLVYPKAKVSPIRVVITNNGKVYRRSVGISCNVSDWSVKKQKCAVVSKEEKLKSIRIRLESHLNEFSTDEQINGILDWALSGAEDQEAPKVVNGKVVPTFWEHFSEYVERPCKSKRCRKNRYNKIKALMGDGDNWNDIDSSWAFRFIRKMEDEGIAKNSQGTYFGMVKTIMREGAKLNYHSNLAFLDFRRMGEDTGAIYLTEDELQLLWDVKLAGRKTEARDLFLLGVYTASRYSDVVRLTTENVVGNTLRFTQQKTGIPVIMPLSPKVKLLMDRNGGHSPQMDVRYYDVLIKKVCKDAGINTPCERTITLGAKSVTKREPKWKFVSSHTARRTGATLLYLSGLPERQIMLITGHQSESNFAKYIRITKEENAQKLMDSPFFK